MLFIEGSGNFLQPTIIVIEVTGFWIEKKHKCKETLKNKSFHNLEKVPKSSVPN